MNPSNYRPISLTSHIMKVFEHMERNGLIKAHQHGFVSGRGTQTQLLEHYNNIFEALVEGVRLGTIYLDIAKAFDKVNHDILIMKVMNHKINGK